ncbi:MAG: type II toxin-antitoxin system Phd/YefM family antitoxin [Candidatus Omnitrophica bacterium]|nr:type II toxin-antitoxin system Phd/YefM family antitoxin [Candidatus Omnitrophota bacterium]
MTRTLPLSEVKMKFSQLVDAVTDKDDEIVITRNGKPVAVLLSADEFDSWKETQEIKNNPELMREIETGLKAFSKGGFKKHASAKNIL